MRTSLHCILTTAGATLPGFVAASARADILYVTNYGSNTIEKFTSGGGGSVFANSGLIDPTGLAFDSAGNLYTTTGNDIVKFTPTGTASYFARNGLLYFPDALAFTDDAGVPLPLANQRPIPEPTTWALLGLCLPALLGFSRPRR